MQPAPPTMFVARSPSAAPKEAGGSSNTTPIPRQPLTPLPASSPTDPWKPHPHGLPGHRHWETPAETPADNLAETGCTGVRAAPPHQTPQRCHSMSPRPWPSWTRTPLAPTNATQHINITSCFLGKVDKSLNQRALQSMLRPGALPVPVGRDGESHPAPEGGWRRAVMCDSCDPISARTPQPLSDLILQQLADNPSEV